MKTSVLLYNFTAEENKRWTAALAALPEVPQVIVDKELYAAPLCELLDGTPAAVSAPYAGAGDFAERMLVMEGVDSMLFDFLLRLCDMITGENVLRAIVTDTNRNWNSIYLHEQLMEEERQVRAWQMQRGDKK